MTRNFYSPGPIQQSGVYHLRLAPLSKCHKPFQNERRWSALRSLRFWLGLAACCWAVFIVLAWWFS